MTFSLTRHSLQTLPFLSIATMLLFHLLFLPTPPSITLTLAMPFLFHWLLYRPDLISGVQLALIGLGYDVMMGQWLGQSSLELLCLYAWMLHQRQHLMSRTFIVVWGGFAAFTLVALVFSLFLQAVSVEVYIPSLLVVQDYVLLCLYYPLLSLVISYIHRAIP